ncbi:MAG: helix-turn-helix domain-containing protein [Corynebacterium provencense]|jgi:excisionase family DNA binding protein|uniref:helix-turn-helix domain-containing protein n=1 Tax=Corynebacterium provencense TaxID=1737425 RepID=UPI002989A928|nr:helix-turn-helix domain-containing protein [Corynebacterium provencense]
MPHTSQKYLTYQQAAQALGVHPGSVGRWVSQGLLDSHVDIRDRRRRLVAVEDVERLAHPTPAVD